MERSLVTKRVISQISPIEGADNIVVALVDGWRAIVKKSEFREGQEVAYIEIDSFLPDGNPAWQFLVDKSSKKMQASDSDEIRKGHVLKTIKLKGQISQGLILPVDILEGLDPQKDYAAQLGIEKYEPLEDKSSTSSNLRGGVKMRGFPFFIPKTDQERVQNLSSKLPELTKNQVFTLTEKLEGSSMTVYVNSGTFGVCSRNVEFKLGEDSSVFITMAQKLNLEEKMLKMGKSIAIQGELIGPKIQGNIYKLDEHKFYVFSVYDIASRTYLPWFKVNQIVNGLNLQTVPVLGYHVIPPTVDEILEMAKGKSKLNPETEREGIVLFRSDMGVSFKAINNDYLLKK